MNAQVIKSRAFGSHQKVAIKRGVPGNYFDTGVTKVEINIADPLLSDSISPLQNAKIKLNSMLPPTDIIIQLFPCAVLLNPGGTFVSVGPSELHSSQRRGAAGHYRNATP